MRPAEHAGQILMTPNNPHHRESVGAYTPASSYLWNPETPAAGSAGKRGKMLQATISAYLEHSKAKAGSWLWGNIPSELAGLVTDHNLTRFTINNQVASERKTDFLLSLG